MEIVEVEINTDMLGSDISKLRTGLSDLKNHTKNMVNEIDELNQMWRGPANTEFNSQFQSDKEALNELFAVLSDMIDAMENARNKYDNCEGKVGQLVAGIKI